MRNYKMITNEMLTLDKKSVLYLFCGLRWILKYDLKHLWKPHEDKGIWKTELLIEEHIGTIGKPFLDLLNNYIPKTYGRNKKLEKMQTFRGAKQGLSRNNKKRDATSKITR